MADRYWVGADAGATANWNTTASWSTSSGGSSGASVPGSSDAVIFDGGGSKVGGCIIDAAVNVASINATSGFTGAGANDGHVDNATNDQTVTVSGDVTLDCKTVSMGDATWTVSGHFDNKDVTAVNRNASTLVMDGTSKNLTSALLNAKALNILTVSGSVSVVGGLRTFGLLSVSGTLNIDAQTNIQGNMTITGTASVATGITLSTTVATTFTITGGTLTGAGTGKLTLVSGCTLVQNGTLSVPLVEASLDVTLSSTSGATFGGNWTCTHSSTLNRSFMISGNSIFTGNISWDGNGTGAGVYAITAANYNIEFRGNVTISQSVSVVTWTKGSGTITFSGSANQTVDLLGKTVEDIVINKDNPQNKVTFTGGFTTDSLTLTKGTLAFGAVTVPQTVRSLGDWKICSNESYVDPTNLGMWRWRVDGNYCSPPVHYYQSLEVGGSPAVWLARRRLWGAATATTTPVAAFVQRRRNLQGAA